MSLHTNTYGDHLQVGDYLADRASGELSGPAGTARLEPKVMDLLFLLASQPGQVMSRERITEALWPEVVVGDDSLARAVSKLRQALGDDVKAPLYIETLSKRGYRLLASAQPAERIAASALPMPRRRRNWIAALAILLVALAGAGWLASSTLVPSSPSPAAGKDVTALLDRADDYYFQFSRGDNEAAIELYQRALGVQPDAPGALAGLANALVQRSIRWPQLPGETPIEFSRLRDALAHGHLNRDPASRQLQRAQRLAERAVAVAPDSAEAHKALGFVAGAQGRFEAALASHRRAVQLDADGWGPMINIADLLEITGRGDEAMPHYEQAYAAMTRAYVRNPVQVRPWHPELGTLIAERHRARGDLSAAEIWYRRVLEQSPLHVGATRGLAELLRTGGDAAEAERLCAQLMRRTGAGEPCGSAVSK